MITMAVGQMREFIKRMECDDCSIGYEDAGCEMAGALWNGNKWTPTKKCIEFKKIQDADQPQRI